MGSWVAKRSQDERGPRHISAQVGKPKVQGDGGVYRPGETGDAKTLGPGSTLFVEQRSFNVRDRFGLVPRLGAGGAKRGYVVAGSRPASAAIQVARAVKTVIFRLER